jgi:hypothetical protein
MKRKGSATAAEALKKVLEIEPVMGVRKGKYS